MCSWWNLTVSPLTGSISWLLGSTTIANNNNNNNNNHHLHLHHQQQQQQQIYNNNHDDWQIIITSSYHHHIPITMEDDHHHFYPTLLSETQFSLIPDLQPIPELYLHHPHKNNNDDELDSLIINSTPLSDHHSTAPSTPRMTPSVSPNEPLFFNNTINTTIIPSTLDSFDSFDTNEVTDMTTNYYNSYIFPPDLDKNTSNSSIFDTISLSSSSPISTTTLSNNISSPVVQEQVELIPIPLWLWSHILQQRPYINPKINNKRIHHKLSNNNHNNNNNNTLSFNHNNTLLSGRGCMGKFSRQSSLRSHKGIYNRPVNKR